MNTNVTLVTVWRTPFLPIDDLFQLVVNALCEERVEAINWGGHQAYVLFMDHTYGEVSSGSDFFEVALAGPDAQRRAYKLTSRFGGTYKQDFVRYSMEWREEDL